MPELVLPDIVMSSCAKENFDRLQTYSEVRDKAPLLHRLVVRGLGPDQGEGEREAGVVGAHHHGRHAGS